MPDYIYKCMECDREVTVTQSMAAPRKAPKCVCNKKIMVQSMQTFGAIWEGRKK